MESLCEMVCEAGELWADVIKAGLRKFTGRKGREVSKQQFYLRESYGAYKDCTIGYVFEGYENCRVKILIEGRRREVREVCQELKDFYKKDSPEIEKEWKWYEER